jgi:hypothetical protein
MAKYWQKLRVIMKKEYGIMAKNTKYSNVVLSQAIAVIINNHFH